MTIGIIKLLIAKKEYNKTQAEACGNKERVDELNIELETLIKSLRKLTRDPKRDEKAKRLDYLN